MADYKLYCLNGAGKISAAGEWLEANNDDEALALARALKMPQRCELWQGNRLIAHIPAYPRESDQPLRATAFRVLRRLAPRA